MVLKEVAHSSPHGQLLAAFATLKKENDSLVALTALQKIDKETLREELDVAKKYLANERAKVDNFEAMLELKTASMECQLAEVENFSKDALGDALEKNSKFSAKVFDLEFFIKEAKKEKEYLLQRTATLARRDQIQKASIVNLNKEITDLTKKVDELDAQFSSLATCSKEKSNSHKKAEGRNESYLESPELEKARAQWMAEKKEMEERITSLQTSCDTIKKAETITKETHLKDLSKHQNEWQIEKEQLKRQVQGLVSEKECIEAQVAEIAELLEREHVERCGRALSEDADESVKAPLGMTNPAIETQ